MTDTPHAARRQSTASNARRILVTGDGLEALAVSRILHDAGHAVDRIAADGPEAPDIGGMVLTPSLHEFLGAHDVADPDAISIPALERRDLTTEGTVASSLEGDLRFTAADVLRAQITQSLPTHLRTPHGTHDDRARPFSHPDHALDTTQGTGSRSVPDRETAEYHARAPDPGDRPTTPDPGDRSNADLPDYQTADQPTADLLVAADGWLSGTRQRVLPQVTPDYAGYVAWHGTVAESTLPDEFVAQFVDALTVSRGRRDLIATMVLPDESGQTELGARRLHWEWFRPVPAREVGAVLTDRNGVSHDTAVEPGMLQSRFVDGLADHVSEHAPAFRRLVRATPDPGVQPVVDLAVPHAVVDRAVLVGDAAFSARQHTGAGVTKALQDATALVHALDRYDDLDDALRDWAATQEQAGRRLVEQGRQTDLDHLLGQV